MPESLRTFVAVRIPPSGPLRNAIAALDAMGRAVRTSSVDQLHVTLKFLGETASDQVDAIAAVVAGAVADQPAFDLEIVSLGTFPHVARPSVVWAGVRGAEPLAALAERLDAALEPMGFARESRLYVPHVTLARVKFRPPDALAELVRREAGTRFGAVRIESVELFRSDPGRDGPVYKALAATGLA